MISSNFVTFSIWFSTMEDDIGFLLYGSNSSTLWDQRFWRLKLTNVGSAIKTVNSLTSDLLYSQQGYV